MLARPPHVSLGHCPGSDPGQWPVGTPRTVSRAESRGSRARDTSQTAPAGARPRTVSVTDTDEVEAPRGRRRAGLGAIAPFEKTSQLLGRALEHRPDQPADHVPQGAVGAELELELIAAPEP